jgi:RIO-like serine/threonine protein kinase
VIGATLYFYRVIQKATNNFANKIGEGLSAEVYRGKLDGQEVAVKCFRPEMHSNDEFKNEVST